ncbi:hypothetical protein [Paenibacillus sp. NPDC057934]|uniref:hypothetical protein n=1 Tax=Paenibacillus sp. NPDC057934 TaxID=3346282 RepID=UPI0036DC7A6C
MGIQTDPRYQGNGWARKTALGAIGIAKQRGSLGLGGNAGPATSVRKEQHCL